MFEKYDAACAAYIENMRNNELSAQTVTGYARTFRLFRESMERHGFADVTAAAVMKFRSDIAHDAITTASLYMGQLRQLSEFAARYGYTEAFVFDDAMPPKGKVTRAKKKPYEHVLSVEQIHSLISAERPVYGKKMATWAREQAEVTLMLLSGARNSELRSLTPADLDWANGCIMLRVTKGDKPRMVPFSAAAQTAVKNYLVSGIRPDSADDNAPLFGCVSRKTGEWKPLERTQLSELINGYTKSVIGEESACRSHALRHGFASAALEAGVAVDDISGVLGHADTKVTAIYAQRLHPAKLATSIGNVLESAVASPTAAV